MFDYLINYGVTKTSIDYHDIDINDRMNLEDQINDVRKNYSKLLSLLDDVQNKYLICNQKIANRTKELLSNISTNRTNSVLSQDDEYISLTAEQEALKSGIYMINNQIEYCKNDLRILNSVFYNKF